MRPLLVHRGEKYGRWTVTSYAGVRNNEIHWLCKCDCGEFGVVSVRNLRKGRSLSCGCLALEVRSANGKRQRTHGMKRTAEYRAWCSMITRCENPKRDCWKDYGGRGISICGRWRASFENFLHDMGRRPGPGYSLDRIDNDGDYEPGNCRWATYVEQNNNRRKPQRAEAP